MKYISQINAFYDALETNPLPAPSIALWHALHAIANKTGWQQEFSVSVSSLGLRAGLNEAAVKRARNKLKEAGFIEWRSRAGNQSATYRLTKLYSETSEFVVQNQGQNAPQSVPQTVPQCVPQVVPQSVPINRHRLRLDKEDTPQPPQRGESELPGSGGAVQRDMPLPAEGTGFDRPAQKSDQGADHGGEHGRGFSSSVCKGAGQQLFDREKRGLEMRV